MATSRVYIPPGSNVYSTVKYCNGWIEKWARCDWVITHYGVITSSHSHQIIPAVSTWLSCDYQFIWVWNLWLTIHHVIIMHEQQVTRAYYHMTSMWSSYEQYMWLSCDLPVGISASPVHSLESTDPGNLNFSVSSREQFPAQSVVQWSSNRLYIINIPGKHSVWRE